jgi:uncharacterized RmlC-like cupin family protein
MFEITDGIKMTTSRQFQPIRVIEPDRFDRSTAQTPGSARLAAIAPDTGIKTALWGGIFIVEPGAKTGIHHHGEQETIAYVLDGACLVRWGERGEFSATAKQGDFVHVPAWVPHAEINASRDRPFTWIVVRSTSEPIVINLPENYWD